ncbi:Ras family protein [Histomonas meleagridis]|uniref:Ras family protein n=1 Tax=Histomonas meleagridis TaxID=135588 RepID=UPI003559A25E|nr:Ras family protein [Histomonas meleagridis]KAH0806915.1 Ras family protein [Histomonas meleagridis]
MSDGSELFPQSNVSRADLKLVLLGDSAVGKTKLVERFLLKEYNPVNNSTYALTLYEHHENLGGKDILVSIWDTAGQERFESIHPAFFYGAHAAILVFDATRKETYQHLEEWNQQLVSQRNQIPVIVVANKMDLNPSITRKQFKWPAAHKYPLYYTSAAKGANVVPAFQEAIHLGWTHKNNPDDVMGVICELLAKENQ